MILIFQMAKVASRSWMRLLNNTFPNRPVIHFHTMSDESLNRIDKAVSEIGDAQTIKYLSLPRLGRPPEPIEHHVKNGRWIGPAVDIVAGVRDPVARAVSAVAFLSNRLGYTRYGVTVRDGGTPETLHKLFFKVLHAARNQTRQNDTFVDVLAHAVYDYRRWFQEELYSGFSIDVLNSSFDRDACGLIQYNGHRLLVYRVEDLMEDIRHSKVIATASDFFGQPLQRVPPENTAGETRFRELYKAFAASVSLSQAELDWFYDCPSVTMFYSPEEIWQFRMRWSQ